MFKVNMDGRIMLDQRTMLNGNQRLELGAETIMNSYGWTREAATGFVLRNFAGAAAWDAGGRVDGNWEEISVEDAPYQNYNISATGGNATENFRVDWIQTKTRCLHRY